MGVYNKLFWSVTALVVWYAWCIREVAMDTPMFSEQWWAEMIWWSKFLVAYMPCFKIYVQPVPMTKLKHHHSEIKLVEFFPEKDPEAYKKFVAMSKDPACEDQLLVIRNAWHGVEDNVWKTLKSAKAFAAAADLSKEVTWAEFPEGEERVRVTANLSTLLEDFETPFKSMSFDYSILDEQKYLKDSYKELIRDISPDLADYLLPILGYMTHFLHFFMNSGDEFYTPLHAEPTTSYLLQVANRKRWRLIHKKYMPYLGATAAPQNGLLRTPFYFVDNYPQYMPHTEVILNPGDIMMLTYWAFHEVTNMDPGFQLSLGLRPPFRGFTFGQVFRPLAWFEIATVPFEIIKRLTPSYRLKFLTKHSNNIEVECQTGYTDVQMAYNGSAYVRHDFAMREDGKCAFLPRQDNYQELELSGAVNYKDVLS